MKTGDILNIDSFDPMDLDITYIKDTINEIPKDGLIDINDAERLATIILRCADYCGDILAKAARYSGYKETLKRASKSAAIYRKIKEKITPTVAKEAYADDEEFIEASNNATTAEALLKWLDEKYQNLIKAHILCKNILARHSTVERANSWQGSESEEDYTQVNSKPLPVKKNPKPIRVSEMEPGYVDF